MDGPPDYWNHDYRHCDLTDCVLCQEDVDMGCVMACDDCDSPGSPDSDGWNLMADGRTLCGECFKKDSGKLLDLEAGNA